MAKSKSGGTRSYIRGRVGADVYGIGKDAKGNKQQVVRSLAESVANPQTSSQMIQRMLMKTVSEAAKALRPIIDHSFDGVPAGQPSISQFTKTNLALIRADFDANLGTDSKFNAVKYDVNAPLCGSYRVSEGGYKLPAGISYNNAGGTLDCVIGAECAPDQGKLTFGMLKAMWPLTSEDFVTGVGLIAMDAEKAEMVYDRFHLTDAIADSTIIAQIGEGDDWEWLIDEKTLFEHEMNTEFIFSVSVMEGNDANNVRVAVYFQGVMHYGTDSGCYTVIVSKKTKNGFKHNTASLNVAITDTANFRTYETALATYPVGSQRFLNGGDL